MAEESENRSDLMRAVDTALFGAVSSVFERMVRDLESGKQLPAARVEMIKRLAIVQNVHNQMRQSAEDLS